jgi:hypothetical protein
MNDIGKYLSRPGKVALLSCILAFCINFSNAEEHGLAQDTNEGQIIYGPLLMQNHDSSMTWLEPVSVDLEPRPTNQPLAIIDRQGRLHLLWDTLSSPRFIYHTMQTESGWTTPAPVALSSGTSYILFTPYVDEDGFIHLVWRNWLGAGIENPHRLLYSSFNGNQWTAEEVVARLDYEHQAMVHSGALGEVHVTYVPVFFFSNIYHTTRTETGWSNPVEVKPVHTTGLVWPSMQGGIHFYGDDYLGNMHYSYWQNGVFQVNDRTIEGRVYGRKSVLDGLNNLHLFWTGQVPVPGGQVNGVYHQCLEGNQTFGPQEIPSGSQAISGIVASASDQNSKIGLSWKEAESGQVRLATWDGCVAGGMRTIPFPEELNLELAALALSADPGRICAISRVLYTNTHIVLCAEVR